MVHKPLTYDEYKNRYQKTEMNSSHAILLDRIGKLENLGLILRSAESVGIKKVYLYKCQCQLDEVKLKRLSRSASERVTLVLINQDELSDLSRSYNIIGIELTNISKTIYELKPSDNAYLMIGGSETSGISLELLRLCQASYHLPICGPQSSINLACAMTSAMHYIAWITS